MSAEFLAKYADFSATAENLAESAEFLAHCEI